jgi:hypothetical protein
MALFCKIVQTQRTRPKINRYYLYCTICAFILCKTLWESKILASDSLIESGLTQEDATKADPQAHLTELQQYDTDVQELYAKQVYIRRVIYSGI